MKAPTVQAITYVVPQVGKQLAVDSSHFFQNHLKSQPISTYFSDDIQRVHGSHHQGRNQQMRVLLIGQLHVGAEDGQKLE